jgi:hypothetical protein
MRFLHSSRTFIFILISTILVFCNINCAPIKIEKVVAKKADQYKFTSQHDGLKISVDPYFEKNKLLDSFGCDLLSRGILPILIVFENQSSEDGYIMLEDQSSLSNTDMEENIDQIDENQKTKEITKSMGTAQSTGRFLEYSLNFGGGAVLATIPFVLGSQYKYQNEVEIKRNLEQKLIARKIIYQGDTCSGFLYFDIKDKINLGKIKGISLNLKNIRTKETLFFMIKIDNL